MKTTLTRLAIFLLVGLVALLLLNSRTSEPARTIAKSHSSSVDGAKSLKPLISSKVRPPSSPDVGTTLVGLSLAENPRENAHLKAAVDSFDYIESLKSRFDPSGNGYKRLDGIQRKLFNDDYAFAAKAGGFDCQGAELAFERLRTGAAANSTGSSSSPPLEVPHLQSADLAELQRYYDSLIHSGNPGYTNIVAALEKNGIPSPLHDQSFLDASIYVAMQTYMRGLIAEDASHQKGIELRLKAEFGSEGSKIAGNYAELVKADLDEMNEVIAAYRSIFERRFASKLGNSSDGLMEKLDALQLGNAGQELRIACP